MEYILNQKPKNPVIIQGFPSFGLVGTIATGFLIDHLAAKPIGSGDVPFIRIVALVDNQIVGTATYEVDQNSLYFGSLGVLERYRKKGYGK